MLTDRNHRFDEIAAGYRGKLYLEVVPRTFAIRVKTGLALNQVRLIAATRASATASCWRCTGACRCCTSTPSRSRTAALSLGDGLFLSLDVSGGRDSTVGYRAKKNSLPIDLTQGRRAALAGLLGARAPRGQAAHRARARGLLPAAVGRGREHPAVLRRRDARLRSDGRRAAHPLRRLLRPGLRLLAHSASAHGSRAALEVRARDVSFMVEHRQPVCKLAFERMAEEPDVLYGEDVGSNYQGQQTMLSKHFLGEPADADA